MAEPLIYVVIPNWNGKDMIAKCLDSLQTQSQKHQIIVVDNGSKDGSQEFIKHKYPTVKLVELDRNYGFAGGVNAGIELAIRQDAEYIALLNNDAVAESDWLEGLARTLTAHPKAGIVTSKILRMDKKHLDSTGDFYSIWGLPYPRGRNELDIRQYDENVIVFAASGGASLYRADMLKQIGLFDEDFFAYFEDVDISFRAQLAGWRVRYQPKAVVYHHISATSSKLGDFARYHSAKNFLLLYAKNMPGWLYWKYLPLFCLLWLRWLASSTIRGKLVPFTKGTLAAVRLHFSTTKKRKAIQRARKVKLKDLDVMLYHHRPPKLPKPNKTV